MQFSEKDLKEAKSKNLAGYVVAYRLLGVHKNLSIKCMEELMNRRSAGEDFNFEEYIENELKDAPKPNDLTSLQNILKGIL